MNTENNALSSVHMPLIVDVRQMIDAAGQRVVYREEIVATQWRQLGWTIEKLKQKHPSNPYNPDIANAFFRAGLIEAWERGIQKITSECQMAGLPVPEYRYDFSGFILEFNAST